MGILVQFNSSQGSRRAQKPSALSGVRGEIVFFTGVQYVRPVENGSAPSDTPDHNEGPARSKRKRKRA